MITKHAAEGLAEYAKVVPAKHIRELVKKIKVGLQNDGSTACIVYLDKPIENHRRDDWAPNDVISAVIRQRQVVTVMLTRTSQVNKGHFRTEFVIGA
jgi:hypothetical protein